MNQKAKYCFVCNGKKTISRKDYRVVATGITYKFEIDGTFYHAKITTTKNY